MRRRPLSAFAVGLAVLVAGAIATFLGVTRTNPFHSGYDVHAIFASGLSGGLHSGSPVRIAGVNVGHVTGVARGPGGTADVTMEISSAGQPIHRDATVKARPRIFLEGNFFLDLQPGTPSAPAMPSGGTIPLSQTALPVQFDQVLDTLQQDTRTQTRTGLSALASALRRGGADALRTFAGAAPPALANSAIAMQALRGQRTGDLAAFVAGAARVAATLDAHRAELGDLITRFRVTMDALAAQRRQLAASVPALRDTLAVAPPALARLDGALPPLRALSVALRPALRAAPAVLDHAGPFLAQARALLGQDRLGGLVAQLGPATGTLRRLEGSLPGLMQLVQPVASCITNNVLPVLTAQAADGALSTGEPVWLDLLHGGIGLTSSQQGFGGDGFGVRYALGIDQGLVATSMGGAQQIVELTGSPMLGARPAWTPGHQPPFRPGVPCATQPVQSLSAATVAVPRTQRRIALPAARALSPQRLARRVRDGLERLARRLP